MKKLILVLVAAATAFTFSSCKKEINGSGHYADQTRHVGTFDEVESSGDFKVVLVEDEQNFVELHGEDNILPEVKTDVSGDKLRIYFDHNNYCYDYNDLTITVHSPSFTDIDLQGAGKIICYDTLFSNLDVNLSGSGKIDLMMDNTHVSSRISGSGEIYLGGFSSTASHTISGSGNIHAFDLISSDVTVVISGSGNCQVNAIDFLNVTISGSGNVFYLGNPRINSSINGSGNVIPN